MKAASKLPAIIVNLLKQRSADIPAPKYKHVEVVSQAESTMHCLNRMAGVFLAGRCGDAQLRGSLSDGQNIADSMGYIPLPSSVVEKVKAASEKIQ